ncbi:MAG: shikimate dehydrogenase [Rhodobacteraceae bacterium]|nr:shikimate dehydrogenase [Paracoccaceae bacterium]
MTCPPATRPTLYFIGVTTASSSIMRVFPAWAKHLGLNDAVIRGMDFKPHDAPAKYREAVAFIREDPLSLGALVTTHKLDLFDACHDLFGVIDPLAALMSEVSSISKRDGNLVAHAKDPIASGLALDGFLPRDHFVDSPAQVFAMGAGGSTIALTWHLMQENRGANRPAGFVISNRSTPRLDHIRAIHEQMNTGIPVTYHQAATAADNDRLMAQLPPGSVVINATGLGKDAPGSPLGFDGIFPENGIVWELNYRGDLVFLDQANAAKKARNLQVEDGWTYFIHGWTQVIAEVFAIDVPAIGPGFGEISRIALEASGRAP